MVIQDILFWKYNVVSIIQLQFFLILYHSCLNFTHHKFIIIQSIPISICNYSYIFIFSGKASILCNRYYRYEIGRFQILIFCQFSVTFSFCFNNIEKTTSLFWIYNLPDNQCHLALSNKPPSSPLEYICIQGKIVKVDSCAQMSPSSGLPLGLTDIPMHVLIPRFFWTPWIVSTQEICEPSSTVSLSLWISSQHEKFVCTG